MLPREVLSLVGNGGNSNTLYIAAGIQDETQGLFAAISVVPEPPSSLLLLLGALAMAATRRRGRTI